MNTTAAHPIVPFSPPAPAGCAVCDSLPAVWFFPKAPSVFTRFKTQSIAA